MTSRANRQALQIVIALAGLVPVGAGLAGIALGPSFAGLGDPLGLPASADPSLDSHFRYLSGLLLAIGLLFWSAIPMIERRGDLVRALTLIVVIGGLGRAVSLFEVGAPDAGMRFGLIMELVVTPLVCLWQFALERQARSPVRAHSHMEMRPPLV